MGDGKESQRDRVERRRPPDFHGMIDIGWGFQVDDILDALSDKGNNRKNELGSQDREGEVAAVEKPAGCLLHGVRDRDNGHAYSWRLSRPSASE